MAAPVKFRSHIEKVWRMPPDQQTRLGKLRLDKNERIETFPDSIWQEFYSELSQEQILAYPEVWPLYTELAVHHRLAPENFLLTAGSDAAIRHCFEAFVAPGNTVVYPDPTFAMVGIYCDLYGAERVGIGYDHDLQLDTDRMIQQIDDRTALVILANPNSPTGTAITETLVMQILTKAAMHRVPVMIDEAYYGFCRITAEPLMSEFDNLIVTRSLSKVAGLAGLRIGYAMAHPEVTALLGRFRPMYEINACAVLFARKLLANWDAVLDYGKRTAEGRDRLAQALQGLGLAVVNTETNFIHVDLGTAKETVLQTLEQANILVRGMLNVSGYQNHTRFSVGPWDTISSVLEIISRVLADAHKAKE